ncbi:MAG: hypothetical protein PHQ75_04670, partial [Thermoguttaceae bacterium]|nr:hypothetical protein [Thermoguttaceae bacterium]
MKKFSVLTATRCTILCVFYLLSISPLFGVEYPGNCPGKAHGTCSKTTAVLENDTIKISWSLADGCLKPIELMGKIDGARLDLSGSECFCVSIVRSPHPQTRTLKASSMKLEGVPVLTRIDANPKSVRLADRQAGWRLDATLYDAKTGLETKWNALLRDGSNYVRQSMKWSARKDPVEIVELTMFEGAVPNGQVAGQVDGSPIIGKCLFLGIEDPASSSSITDGIAKCCYPFHNAITKETPFELSLVMGVHPVHQLRRAFLYYLERERACPYRICLHHNNGEQIGEDYYALKKDQKTQKEAAAYRAKQEKIWLDVMRQTGDAMKRRGVTLASYVHDYEWDDEFLVWQFHNGYPQGFAPAAKVATELESRLGIWFSPWGGYAGRKYRVQGGTSIGLELNQQHNATGFSLAAPRYYARFRAATINMLRDYHVSYFKFDGFLGSVRATGPSTYRSDFEALWRLLADLRRESPDVFINTSTGSWPSPFWLMRTDAIWRGGSDTGLAGAKGSARQQWVSYRDMEVYNLLTKGPLYPISSLMIHGLMVNQGGRVTTFNEQDIIDEAYSFFATGVNVQELYIDPEVMNDRLWDAVAEAASWAKKNEKVLADVHWAGGAPAKLEIYGWAAWSPAKAVLTLRNPDDKNASITLDISKVFELSNGAAKTYSLKSPWKKDSQAQPVTVTARKPHTFTLKP